MIRNILNKYLIGLVSFSLIGASIFSVASCTRIPPPGYHSYVYNDTDCPFSFEYPEEWNVEVYPSSLWKGVHIFGGPSSPANSGESEGLYIFLASVSQTPKYFSYSNAHELIQQQLEYGSRVNEFHLLGQGDIKLGKEIGEWVSFSKYDSYVVSLALPTEQRHITCRHVAVDYKGRIYWLRQEVNTDLVSYEEFKPGFDHILKTFKFLN
jgi:hypothetical protein